MFSVPGEGPPRWSGPGGPRTQASSRGVSPWTTTKGPREVPADCCWARVLGVLTVLQEDGQRLTTCSPSKGYLMVRSIHIFLLQGY